MMIKRLPNLISRGFSHRDSLRLPAVIGLILAAFPLILWGLILPSDTKQGTFINPRLVAIFALLLFVFFVSLLSKNSLTESLRSLRHLPAYFYPLAAYLIIVCLSSITSPNPGIAWFGEPTAQAGALFLIALALLFTGYARFKVPGLMRVFAVITFAAALLTLAQFLGFRPIDFIFGAHLDTSYPIGTTAYRGHLAGMFAFLSLLPLYAFYSKPKTPFFWLWLIAGNVGLALATSSAATLACAVCLAIYLVVSYRVKQLRQALLVVLVFVAAIYGAPRVFKPVNTFLANHHIVAAATNPKENLAGATTLDTRLLLWKSAFHMWQAKPWLGWGAEQFDTNVYAFLSRADGDSLTRLEMGLTPDTKITRIGDSNGYVDSQGDYGVHKLVYKWPHSIIMEQLEAHGILGLLAYLTFFIMLLLAFLRHKARGIVAALPYLSYFIYLTAWFYTVSVTPLAWIMLGAIVYDLQHRDVPVKVPAATKTEADATLKPAGALGTLSSAE